MKETKKCTFLLGFIFMVFGISSCSNTETSKASKPNVVIILADDLGYGDISYFGQENYATPNIDKLMNEGVVATHFYVPTPYCAPSRATLLTGRFPLRHGLIKNPTPDAGINDIGIQKEEITLGEILQEENYKTMCIGKWHLGHKEEFFPVNHGFDTYYGILYSNDMRPVQIIENRDTVEYPVDQSLLTKKYTQKALSFISENQEEPFFLHLCHAMPHKPLAASDKFYTPDTPTDLYADVMRELDWSVGEVVKHLDDLKILDNTILIFMSDNGPWYGGSTAGLKGMKATTWEGGTRVPFSIRYPKEFNANTVVDIPLWSPDIFPTILSLAKINPSKTNVLDGQDITKILKGEEKAHSPIFTMIDDRIMTIRKGDFKLFVNIPRYKRLPSNWVDSRGPDGTTIIAPMEQARPEQYPGVLPAKSAKEIQLFNVKYDISEAKELSEAMPEKVKELIQDYEYFKKSLVN